MDEYQKLMRAARRMLQAGHSREAVDSEIARYTANLPRQMNSYMDLFNFINEGINPIDEAEVKFAETSPVSDFARSFAQGASFGFADELAGVGAALVPGGRGFDEAVEASRARIENLREVAPGATLLSEIAGGVGVPVGGGIGIARGLIGRGVPHVLAGAAGGTGAGLLAGGLVGAGEAEGGPLERLPEAGIGAGIGAVAGGLLGGATSAAAPVVGRAARWLGRELTPTVRPGMAVAKEAARAEAVASRELAGQSRRGQRIAVGLAETSGAQKPTVRAAVEAEEAGIREVREQMYRPLEEQFGKMDMPEVQEVLAHPDIRPTVARVVPDIDSRPPSFKELQEVRQRLLKQIEAAQPVTDRAGVRINPGRPAQLERYTSARARLTDAMEEVVPGYREANAAYNSVRGTKRAFDRGRSMYGQRFTPDEIEMALADLPDEVHRQAFRDGMVMRWVDALNSREGVSPAAAKRIMEAGPSMRGRLRAMFPDDTSWDEFQRLVATEENALRFTQATRRLVRLAWVTGGFAGGGFAASLLFGGN
jgi:hypothetical protein